MNFPPRARSSSNDNDWPPLTLEGPLAAVAAVAAVASLLCLSIGVVGINSPNFDVGKDSVSATQP